MKMLTAEITKLLDKLYNLRGEDSVILSNMETDRLAAEETKERTTNERVKLQEKIESLTEEERILAEEGEQLLKALSSIKTNDFKIVLEKLNVNFDPDKLSSEVNELLPQTIARVQEEKEEAKDALVSVETEMSTAVATIEELLIRKEEALSDQARLNEYFDLAINGNINITRDAITSLLEKMEFSPEESREAAKILMFPEDALYDYENKKNNNLNSEISISEMFSEDVVKEVKISKSPREDLIDLLTELEFDYLDFTSNDIEKILANYNEYDLRKNVEFAKNSNIKMDIFKDNIELFYDKEFDAKITKLLEVGKEPIDIYLNPLVLMKYDANTLVQKISNFESSGLDPRKIPLMAY